MDQLSIKIKIGDREYPMRVPMEEEERLRTAGRLVNERIKKYSQKFGIDDKQDLLAMVAFDALVEKLKSEAGSSQNQHEVENILSELDGIISKAL